MQIHPLARGMSCHAWLRESRFALLPSRSPPGSAFPKLLRCQKSRRRVKKIAIFFKEAKRGKGCFLNLQNIYRLLSCLCKYKFVSLLFLIESSLMIHRLLVPGSPWISKFEDAQVSLEPTDREGQLYSLYQVLLHFPY